MTTPLASALFASLVCVGVISLLLRSGLAQHVIDLPNDRSLHAAPVPRIGGLGVVAGVLPVILWQPGREMTLLGVCVGLLALVSLADDRRALPVAVRLAAHALAAAVMVGVAATPLPASALPTIAGALLAGVAIAWMTNLFNFMDGADGLAGGMAVIGFGALAWAAGEAGQVALCNVAAAVSVASLGFLAFNFPAARVFLGDAGSIPLGFLAGTLGWLGILAGAWPAWFPVLVFSPFIVDASVTLVIRAWRGEPLFRAHRSHHYQQLILGGWSHRRLAVSAWLLMACAAGTALAARQASAEAGVAIIAGWAAVYAFLLHVIRRSGRGGPAAGR